MTTAIHGRYRFGAWLALLAMCLIVFAPLISQANVAAGQLEPEAAICSAGSPSHVPHFPHTGGLSACGYCDLLATPAAPPPIAAITPASLPLRYAVFTAHARRIELPAISCNAGNPRAPPFNV